MKKRGPHKESSRLKAFNYGGTPTNLSKQPVPPSKIDNSDSIIAWEVAQADAHNRNNFPQQLLQNVYNSPVGSSALDIWQEFVEGDGFVDPDCGKFIINKDGETMESLHQKVSADIAFLWGFAVHVSYNAKGLKSEFHHLPFEETRLGIIDKKSGEITDIRFNPYFGIPQDKYYVKTKIFYTYNPDPDAVVQEMKEHKSKREKGEVDFDYPGQAFWFSIERPLARVYPQPFYFSSINWFKIDADIQKFHERNIDNNFLLSVIINMIGDPDQPAGGQEVRDKTKTTDNDDDDQFETVGEVLDRELKEHFSGAQNGGSALINWIKDAEDKANIELFPTNSHHDLFLALQKITTDQISIGTKTPPILLSIREGGKLGDSQEIVNAVMVMQSRTRRMRNVLKREYTGLMMGFTPAQACRDYTIKPANPFNILPQWAFNSLTLPERRAYIADNFNINLNIKEISTEKTTDDPAQAAAQAQLKGSVGGVQGILSIQQNFSNKLTSRESALAILTLIYGFTNDEASELLGNPEVIKNTGTVSQNISIGENGEPVQEQEINEIFTDLSGRQLQNIQRIVRKYNKEELTFEQASQALKSGYGMTDDEVSIWLGVIPSEGADDKKEEK